MNSWLGEQSIDFSLRLYTIVNVLLSTQVESKRPKSGGIGWIFWLYWDGLQGLFRKMSHIGAFAVTVSCWYWLWSKMSWHQLLGVGLAPVVCGILSTYYSAEIEIVWLFLWLTMLISFVSTNVVINGAFDFSIINITLYLVENADPDWIGTCFLSCMHLLQHL